MNGRVRGRSLIGGVAVSLAALSVAAGAAAAAFATYRLGSIRGISSGCRGQNAEVEEAVDPAHGYVYEVWIGCNGIGFARSTDGGRRFHGAVRLPGSGPLAWDPAVAVASNGSVYAAFMVMKGSKSVPVVVASFDHGATFPQKTVLSSPRPSNWGDRDFIAAGPGQTVYLTWDYGPATANVKLECFPIGSCAITAGEVNIVMQISSDGARSFGPMVHVTPGFPAGGGESAPLLVEPSGQIDMLYARQGVARGKTHRLGAGHEYFRTSVDGGRSWAKPVEVGRSAGTISSTEWWIDGAIGSDADGNLYATWDTQGRSSDVGWLSYSTDRGASWSRPIRVSADSAKVAHIVQVAGGPAGIAYVGWLSDRRPRGYAQFLRTFSITRGWLSAPQRISRQFGNAQIWPGDTFGIGTLSASQLVLSWGSAIRSTHGRSEIFAAPVTVALPGS